MKGIHRNATLCLRASMKTSRSIRPQLIGILCEWFRPIVGTHQEGNPRPPCVLPDRLRTPRVRPVLPMCHSTRLPVVLPGSSTQCPVLSPTQRSQRYVLLRTRDTHNIMTIIGTKLQLRLGYVI